MQLLQIKTYSVQSHVLLTKVYLPYNGHKLAKQAYLVRFLRIYLVRALTVFRFN